MRKSGLIFSLALLGCAAANTYAVSSFTPSSYSNPSKSLVDRVTSRNNSLNFNNLFSVTNMNTNWASGGNLGVQVWRNLGVEGGGYYFQDGMITAQQQQSNPAAVQPVMDTNQQAKYKSWVGYLAMKAKAPLMRMLDVYAKFGAGYEHQDTGLSLAQPAQVTTDSGSKSEFHSWVPVFSVGLEDHLTKSLNLNVQYMHLADGWQMGHDAKQDEQANKFTHKDIITMSLGYLFKL